MERTLSTEERIRRAEEIYHRRQEQTGVRVRSSSVNARENEKKNISLLKKMVLQIAICLVIYFIFYLIQNSNFLFSQQVLDKTKEVLSYDINFQVLYEQINAWMENTFGKQQEQESEKQLTEQEEKEQLPEQKQDERQQTSEESLIEGQQQALTDPAIGGAIEAESHSEQVIEEEPKDQMEIDAEEIKNNYSVIKPLSGTITSRFRMEESYYSNRTQRSYRN